MYTWKTLRTSLNQAASSTAKVLTCLQQTKLLLTCMDNGMTAVGPAKAANAGGVACSCIEMGQNAGHTVFQHEDVYASAYTRS